jgi:hypothetical protein
MGRKPVSILISVFFFTLVISSAGYGQGTSVGVKAGTLGAGLEIERALGDSFGARVGVNYFTYDYSGTEDDVSYNFDLNLQTVSLLLDWHPFKGTFRLSGGLMINGNDIDSTADLVPTESYNIGDSTFTAADLGTLTGKFDFNNVAPYLGLGWNTSFGSDRRWAFLCDLGVLFQGSPNVDLTSTGGIQSNNPFFLSELAKEEQNLQDDLDEYKYYPVVAIGLSYVF